MVAQWLAHLPLVLEVPGSIPARGEENLESEHVSSVSFAGTTLDKCIVLQIRMLTECPLCRESHPLCRLKNPTVISIWLFVGFHPATRSVQCTPVDAKYFKQGFPLPFENGVNRHPLYNIKTTVAFI